MLTRGQTLLEACLAMAFIAAALGFIAATLARNAGDPQSPARSAALEYATNAATEALAATEYDPAALARIASARWSVEGVALEAVVQPGGMHERSCCAYRAARTHAWNFR